jgi:hypothetical protein
MLPNVFLSGRFTKGPDRTGTLEHGQIDEDAIMSSTPRFSQLTPARQALVRLCQAINHGSIENLGVENTEPVLKPQQLVLKSVKLDCDEGPRPELALRDFVVSEQVGRLLSLLDQIGRGAIRHIEIRAGVPRRIVVESKEMGII